MIETGIENAVKKFREDVQGLYLAKLEYLDQIFTFAQEQAKNHVSMEDFERKMSFNFLKEIILRVKNDELSHKDFFLEGLKSSDFWKPLAKLVLFKRIEELRKCKVLKKGKKYDVSGLKETFIGKYIMDRLKFERRSMLDEIEYLKITSAIKKLKYEVPLLIEPTTTEKFFKD